MNRTMAAYREMLNQFLTDEGHLNAVCELLREIAEFWSGGATDAARTLPGRVPISLEQFIRDYQAPVQPDQRRLAMTRH